VTAIAILVTLLAAAAVTPGQTSTQSTPVPAPVAGTMGYYIMQGSKIVSKPFSSAPACNAALANLKSSLPPGVTNVVCAHRVP
jgi:acyl-CoA reductase-like NAD-dependent aldehyde dehydrogenase